jgi:hypothetical protein
VGVVVAVEEAAFPMPVQRHVSRVQVEDDLPRRRAMRVEEQVHEQRLDRRAVMADAVIAAGLTRGRVLQPVQGALAGKRGTAGAPRLQLASENGQHRVMTELVVVDEVLMAKRNAQHTLADQGGDLMLNALRRPRITEAGGEAPHQADGAVGGAEQQRTGIRSDRPAVEPGHHPPGLDRCELKQPWATLRRHRGPPLRRRKALSQKNFRRLRAPMHLRLARNPG